MFWGCEVVLGLFWGCSEVVPGQSCKEEGFLELVAEPLGSRRPRSRPDAPIRICSWKFGALPKQVLEARKKGSNARELPGAALGGPGLIVLSPQAEAYEAPGLSVQGLRL